MDQLRARAYLDMLLGKDSRPRRSATAGGDGGAAPASPGNGPGAPGSSSGPGGAAPAGFAGLVTLTVPLATLAGLADRPGDLAGLGPVDPWLARDLARAAAANPKSTWCLTVTDNQGHAAAHGCARPEPKGHRKRAGPGPPEGGAGFTFTPASRDGPPGGHGSWRLRTPGGGPDLIVTVDPLTTDPCDHRHEAKGHDPGARLRHLSQVRHATCTSPICRRPAAQADFEHNTPYEAGGRTCLCNGGPEWLPGQRRYGKLGAMSTMTAATAVTSILRAVIYLRISKDKAADEHGVINQRGEAERLSASRGYQVGAVYCDNDISAFSGARRPGYEAMMPPRRAASST